MTSKARRQLALLGALTAVLVTVLALQGDDPPADTVPRASRPVDRSAAVGQSSDVANVKLELLGTGHDALRSGARDPFRFDLRPLPARVAPPAARGGGEATPPPLQPAGPPPPPPIALRYIGFAEPDNQSGRVAFFSDRGTVITGKEGDIIDGRYRVLRVGTDSAELAYADGRGRQTIRLSGQ